jgi:hypothetical protein
VEAAVTHEPMMVLAPATNEEGIERALRQVPRLNMGGWTVEYDRRRDTMYWRAPNHGAAIGYWLPSQPEILFYLDATTAQLTGIDLTHYRKTLIHVSPAFKMGLRLVRSIALAKRIPVLGGRLLRPRRKAEVLREELRIHLSPA